MQTMQVGHQKSDKAIFSCGVPQGSILGPLLSCYMSMISTDAQVNLGFTSLQITLTFCMQIKI